MRKISSLIFLSSLLAGNAAAQSVFDSIRDTDLNDYALGVAVSTSKSIYKGSENSSFLYPFLSSGEHPAFNDRSFIATEGSLGYRFVTDNGWDLGILGRIETLSLEADQDLPGIKERKATLELGPSISYRGWPIQLNFTNYFGVLDRHGGSVSELDISYPIQFNRGYIIPAVDLNWYSDGYNSYYFGVDAKEASTALAQYDAEGSLNPELKVSWGYKFSDKWRLRGRLGFEFLSDEVTNSPLVDPDSDTVWSATLGVDYNADIFGSRDAGWDVDNLPRSEIKLALFNANISTEIQKNPLAGTARKVDFEDLLNISDEETVVQFDALFRLANYHRVEFSYLDLDRSGYKQIDQAIAVGEESFSEGSFIDSSIETQTARFTYGYSLLLSNQAEFGIKAGLHQTQIKSEFVSASTDQRERSDVSPLLPVLGVYGSISLSKNFVLLAEIQAFRMEFDNYEGSLNYGRAEVQWNQGRFGIGLGFSYYGMDLDAKKDDLSGRIEFRYNGPAVSASFRF